ncbi:MAG: CBS domain-containing protein, partial [Phycisphaerae bacterium]|nr:CBS domain-containing protein [Phycisphaerae bacterium]
LATLAMALAEEAPPSLAAGLATGEPLVDARMADPALRPVRTEIAQTPGDLLAPPGLSAVVAEGRASGALTQFQSIMADRIANINEVTLADVMVPMSRVMSAPAGVTRDELRRLIRQHNYSRVPVMDEGGAVVGILDVYEALIDESDAPPEAHATLPLVLPASMIVTEALWRMQRTRTRLAVVARNERPVGIATVKDLVEEIVGELRAW